MAESFKNKKVQFPKGLQREFILKSKEKLELTWNKFARFLNMSNRQLTDWKNEKFLMSYKAVHAICQETKISFPKNIKVKDQYWYVFKGARKGGLARYKKYGSIGNPEMRLKKWREWWNAKGRYQNNLISQPYPFNRPCRSKKLAEFVGIMLGDGGISEQQITVTLHCVDDAQYAKFVCKLFEELFRVKPSMRKKKCSNAVDIQISRVLLVKFCAEKLGLPIGNKVKQKANIPLWVKSCRAYRIACLRGLVDTDGSMIKHRYKSNSHYYCYNKISYSSRSFPLLKSASDILNELNIKHRFTKNKFEIRIESKEGLKKYIELVGSHNPKHLKKYMSKV